MPTKGRQEKPNAEKAEGPTSENEKRGVAGAVSALANTISNEEEATRAQQHRQERGERFREYLTLGFIVLTTISVFIQARIFYFQLDEMKKTFVLTNSLVEATNLQARTIIATESPLAGVTFARLYNSPTEKGAIIGTQIVDGVPPESGVIGMGIVSAGKAAARVIEMAIDWQVTDALPKVPVYKSPRGANLLLSSKEIVELYFDDVPFQITPTERQEILIKRKMLWVYGYVTFRDLEGAPVDVGFVYHWRSENGFVGIGPTGYVYERKRPK